MRFGIMDLQKGALVPAELAVLAPQFIHSHKTCENLSCEVRTIADDYSSQYRAMMLLVLFARLLSPLLRWLEPYYLRWTRLPQSPLTLTLPLDLTPSKPELLIENGLLR
jgi:hypothetical protein